MSVVPTKGNLISAKKSLALSKLGFDLMDKKRNILMKEILLVAKHMERLHAEINSTYRQAYEKLKLACVTLGTRTVLKLVNFVPVDESIKISHRSVMGVEVPVVSLDSKEGAALCYGIYDSNSVLDEAYKKFYDVKKLVAKLAECEVSIYRLASAIQTAKKRANSLSNIIVPKFENSIKYINDYLEEKDREEFSRLKVVKKQKSAKT